MIPDILRIFKVLLNVLDDFVFDATLNFLVRCVNLLQPHLVSLHNPLNRLG